MQILSWLIFTMILNFNSSKYKVFSFFFKQLWHRGLEIITTAQVHSTKPEIRFCAGLHPARSVPEIRDCEDLWQCSRQDIRLNAFCRSAISQKQFIKKYNSSSLVLTEMLETNYLKLIHQDTWRDGMNIKEFVIDGF